MSAPRDPRARLLTRVPLFAGLDRVTLAKLATHFEPVRYAAGDVVYREGDPGDAFYVVLQGTFSDHVGRAEAGVAARLATRGPGATFGEIALLANRPRSTTVRADTAAEALRLDRGRFLELVRGEPAVALAVAAALSERVRLANVRGIGTAEAAERPVPPLEPTLAGPGVASPGRRALGAGLALLALAATWTLPPPPGLDVPAWRAVGSLVALVPALAFDALPEGVLALATMGLWALGGVVPARIALGGVASTSWALVVAVLAFGAALASTGLLYRVALAMVARSGGGFLGQATTLAVAGVLLGPVVPNATGRVALVAPALRELVEALGYRAPSRPGAGLAMAALVGFGQMGAVFLTSSTTAVLAHAVLPDEARARTGWLDWAAIAAPANLVLLVLTLGAIAWLYRPGPGEASDPGRRREVLAMQQALLGRPTRSERLGVAAAVGLAAGFTTQPLHGLEPAWVAVLAVLALGAAGLVTADTLRSLNWSFVLFFGMLAGLPEVLAATGASRWVAGLAGAAAGELRGAPAGFVAGLALVGIALSLVLRWQAAAPLLTVAAAPVAREVGVSPVLVAVVATIACNGFVLPGQSTTYLALHQGTGGRLFDHRQARPAALAHLAATLVALLASVPAWRLLGLL
jgi:DASS family divalent anion:Na+ symporter